MAAEYTEAQLQALKNALASGVLTVSFGDRTMTYRSVDELKKAIAQVQGEIDKQNGTTTTRQVRTYTSKGF